MLFLTQLAEDALIPLNFRLLGHLYEHLVLVEAQLRSQLLDQQDIRVGLRTLARVEPVKLHVPDL